MLRFKEYQEINEGLVDSLRSLSKKIKKAVRTISKSVKRAFGKLGFGKTAKLKLNYATDGQPLNEAKTDKVDLKSRMGYYSEFCTAYELALLIANAGGSMRGMTVQQLKSHKDKYKKDKLLAKGLNFGTNVSKVKSEAQRMEESGAAMGASIWNDIQDSVEDLEFTEFEVRLTGESGKGITKADIELIAYKKKTNEVIDHIEASLKAYKDWNINVSNSTFTSWVINLVDPDIGGFQTKKSVKAKVDEFVKKYGLQDQMMRIADLQAGPESPAKLKPKIGRAAAKKILDEKGVYIEVRNLMIDVFEKQYKKNKAQINENMIKLLGFDGADTLYLSVQSKAGKDVKVLSSRQSKEFNKILDNMKKDFDIEFEKDDSKVNTSVTFKSGNTVLFKSNFGFRDLDKVSQFVNFKGWM